MNAHPCLVAAGLLLALAACQPGAAEYTSSEAPKNLVLDRASSRIDVRFAPGSNRLSARDAGRLRWLAASGGIVPSDRITVATTGSPSLAKARFHTIAALLLPYGVVASPGIVTAAPANHAIVDTGRYLVRLPACPDWSKDPADPFSNTTDSNFACANAVNLGMSVASPADLAEGRPVGPTDAIPAAAAVERYEADKVQLPGGAAGISPIGAPSTGSPGGGTGAGSAGATP